MFSNNVTTDLFLKATDINQYLHYISSHHEHTIRAITYVQALRQNRNFPKRNIL